MEIKRLISKFKKKREPEMVDWRLTADEFAEALMPLAKATRDSAFTIGKDDNKC